MTHEYTILTGGTILGHEPTDAEAPRPTAVAWAEDTVLAVGSDAEVRAISRGDSRFGDLHGAWVVPAAGASLDPGAAADFDVLDADPASGSVPLVIAVVRAGRVVEGVLP